MSKKPSFVPQEQLSQQIQQEITSSSSPQLQEQAEKLRTLPPAPSAEGGKIIEFKEETKILPIIEVKEIPSKFIPYPAGSTISYRPYTFGEVKKFNQSKLSLASKFELILEGIECSFDKKELTFSDFLFISLLRKISSLGDTKFQISYLCKECGFKNTEVMELSKIDFYDLEIPGFPIILDIQGREMHFSPIRLKQWLELSKNNLLEDKIAFYAKQCENIPYEEAYKLLYQADDLEGEMLLEMDKLCFHSTKPMEFICHNMEREFIEEKSEEDEFKIVDKIVKPCENISILDLDSPEVLVSPFRQPRESIKSRIRFGTKASC